MAQDRDNSGTLYKNDKKSDKSPDYSGKVLINGVPMKIAAWVKRVDGRDPFMSLAFTPEQNTQAPAPKPAPAKPAAADTLDDLPF
jgi:hypothetical protein